MIIRSIKNFVIISFLFLNLFSFVNSFAVGIYEFKIELSKEQVMVWEALDMTISALDEDWNVIKNYEWNIVWYWENEDEFEMNTDLTSDEWYKFKLWDQWVKKFENSLKFFKEWKQELFIYESWDGTAHWSISINVLKKNSTEKYEINIKSPDNWISIWENKITISWTTKPNHVVKIKVNWEKEYSTKSNTTWNFEYKIDDLINWENNITAHVYKNDKEVWVSSSVKVNVESNLPILKSIKLNWNISQNWEMNWWEKIEFIVLASESLKNVNVSFDDTLIPLKETEKGQYIWTTISPNKPWEYIIWVILKDNLAHEFKKDWAYLLKIKDWITSPIMNSSNLEIWTWVVLNITWIRIVKFKNRTVLYWDKVKDADWYKIYKKWNDNNISLVDTIDSTKTSYEIPIIWKEVKYESFAIKAFKKDESWVIREWELSNATKIQTWPEILIFIIVSLIIWWMFLYYRRYKNSQY